MDVPFVARQNLARFAPRARPGMTAFYGTDPAAAEAESLRTIDKALELGVKFLDTAWVRGEGGSSVTLHGGDQ